MEKENLAFEQFVAESIPLLYPLGYRSRGIFLHESDEQQAADFVRSITRYNFPRFHLLVYPKPAGGPGSINLHLDTNRHKTSVSEHPKELAEMKRMLNWFKTTDSSLSSKMISLINGMMLFGFAESIHRTERVRNGRFFMAAHIQDLKDNTRGKTDSARKIRTARNNDVSWLEDWRELSA